MEFVTPFTFKDSDVYGEKKFEKSLTIPDQSLSVRDLLERFTRNVPSEISTLGSFDTDGNGSIDLDNIDPTRLQDYDLVTLTEAQAEFAYVNNSLLEELARREAANAAATASE